MNITKIKSYLPFFALFIAALLLLWTFFKPGLPFTHDSQNHLARMANLYLAIKDHHFIPRWAQNLNYQFGYPVFNYNYYLPYIPGVFLHAVGVSFEQCFKLITFVGLLASGIFTYLFLKNHVSKSAAFAGAMLYMASPWQLVQIFVRGHLGTTTAFGVFAFGLWAISEFTKEMKNENRENNRKLSLWFVITAFSVVLLMLAHNVTFLFGLPIWIVYGLFHLQENSNFSFWQNCKTHFLYFFVTIFLGLGLGGFFILPATLEVPFITLAKVGLSQEYSKHFLYLQQLFYTPWDYGFSKEGIADDGIAFHLGIIQWAVLGLGIILFLFKKSLFKDKFDSKMVGLFALILIVSSFFMLGYSQFIWEKVTILQRTQFPWRLLFVATFSLVVLDALILHSLKNTALNLTVALLALLILLPNAKPKTTFKNDDIFYILFPFTSSVQHENLPEGFAMDKMNEYKPRLADTKNVAQFTEQLWRTADHKYTIETPEDTTVIEHIAYFPGWKTFVNGKQVEINSQLENYPGVMTYKISAGKYEVETIFTEDTWARKLGDGVSVGSIILVMGIAGFLAKKKV